MKTRGLHNRVENIPDDALPAEYSKSEVVIGGPESEDFSYVVAKWKSRPYMEMLLRITVCHPFFSAALFGLSFALPTVFAVDGIDITLFSTLWVFIKDLLSDTAALRNLIKPLISTAVATVIGIGFEAVLIYKIQLEIDEY